MRQKLPPGPRTPSLFQGAGMWTRPVSWLERNRAKYGNRFTTRFPFTPPFVVIADPEQVKEIFTAPPDVLLPASGARAPATRRALLRAPPRWRRAHVAAKLMLPAFHGERMERLTDLVARVTADEVERWNDGEMELDPRFQTLTLEIILQAVFGLEPGPRLGPFEEPLEAPRLRRQPAHASAAPRGAGGHRAHRAVLQQVRPDQGLRRPPRRGRRAPRRRDRRAALSRRRGCRRRPLDAPRRPPRGRLADERFRAPRRAHDPARRRARDDRFLAGVDVLRLARDPRVLAELRREVDTEDGGPYLTATINEVLRSRPVLQNNAPRYVAKPITVGGWDYEPGISLVRMRTSSTTTPRSTRPYTFRPERFLDEKPGTYTWIPFGGGRRRCLGSSFAILEMKVVIAEVVRRFEITRDDRRARGGAPAEHHGHAPYGRPGCAGRKGARAGTGMNAAAPSASG